MLVDIIEPDGRILESLVFSDGKVMLSKNDHRLKERRSSYFQQAHVKKALSCEQIKRRKKTNIEKLHDGFVFHEIEIDEMGRPPVAICGQYTLADNALIRKNEDGYCSASSLRMCTSIWACPVCGRKILHKRAKEIRQAVKHFANAEKYMVTLTARHKRETDLKTFITLFRRARQRLANTKRFTSFRKKSSGYITAAEITWSPRNGWHFHVHELWFNTPHTPDFAEDWSRALSSEGMSSTIEAGYNVKESWDASEYLSKTGTERIPGRWDTGKEVASWQKGRSVWDMAPRNYSLVREHYHATKGARRLTWSKGLKDLVGVQEMHDENIATAADGEIALTIPQYIWTNITKRNLVTDILECVELGGARLAMDTIYTLTADEWSNEGIEKCRELRKNINLQQSQSYCLQ